MSNPDAPYERFRDTAMAEQHTHDAAMAELRAAGKNKLTEALAKAQGQMSNAKFDRINPHFKSKYASLAAILDVIRKPLADNGLAITQTLNTSGAGFSLITTLRGYGEAIESTHPLPQNAKPQEFGSALTYARRYSLSALLNISADEDDDAEGAQKIEDTKITPEQAEHLLILIDAIGEIGTESKLIGYIAKIAKRPIEGLGDIPQSQFATALAALNKKAKAKPESDESKS